MVLKQIPSAFHLCLHKCSLVLSAEGTTAAILGWTDSLLPGNWHQVKEFQPQELYFLKNTGKLHNDCENHSHG